MAKKNFLSASALVQFFLHLNMLYLGELNGSNWDHSRSILLGGIAALLVVQVALTVGSILYLYFRGTPHFLGIVVLSNLLCQLCAFLLLCRETPFPFFLFYLIPPLLFFLGILFTGEEPNRRSPLGLCLLTVLFAVNLFTENAFFEIGLSSGSVALLLNASVCLLGFLLYSLKYRSSTGFHIFVLIWILAALSWIVLECLHLSSGTLYSSAVTMICGGLYFAFLFSRHGKNILSDVFGPKAVPSPVPGEGPEPEDIEKLRRFNERLVRLKYLENLRNSGILTEEEFQEEKKKLKAENLL